MKGNPTIEELFGNLFKLADKDKCTAARKREQEYKERCLPCQFTQIGKTVYCKIHNGLKI